MRGRGLIAQAVPALAVLSLALTACLPFPPVIRGPEAIESALTQDVVKSGEEFPPLQHTIVPPTASFDGTATAVPPTMAAGATRLQGWIWRWTGSTFKDGAALAPGDPSRYTIEFLPDGNALAQADCNFGTGLYKEDGEALTIGAVGATKMACPPDSLDSAFLAQLSKTERYAIEGEELVLTLQDEAGEVRLAGEPSENAPTSTPATPTPLPVTVPPTETATAPVTKAPTATATLLPPIPTATWTAPAFPSPTAIPTVALPTATAVALTATPLVPTARPTDTLTVVDLRGTAWALSYVQVGGQPAPPVSQTAPTLEISVDGTRASGWTGCNEYRTGVSVRGDRIELTGVALLTRKACEWPVMLQEVELIDALLRTGSYSISGGTLVLAGEDGETLAEFTRK